MKWAFRSVSLKGNGWENVCSIGCVAILWKNEWIKPIFGFYKIFWLSTSTFFEGYLGLIIVRINQTARFWHNKKPFDAHFHSEQRFLRFSLFNFFNSPSDKNFPFLLENGKTTKISRFSPENVDEVFNDAIYQAQKWLLLLKKRSKFKSPKFALSKSAWNWLNTRVHLF